MEIGCIEIRRLNNKIVLSVNGVTITGISNFVIESNTDELILKVLSADEISNQEV